MSCLSLHQTRLSAGAGATANFASARVCFYYVEGGLLYLKISVEGTNHFVQTALPCLSSRGSGKQVSYWIFFILKVGASVSSYGLHLWRCPSPGLNQSQRSSQNAGFWGCFVSGPLKAILLCGNVYRPRPLCGCAASTP